MKKLLLMVAAAVLAVTVNAQVASKQTAGKAQSKQKVTTQTVSHKKYEAVSAKQVQPVFTNKLSKRLVVSENVKKSMIPVKKAARRAVLKEEYNAYGNHVSDGAMNWMMESASLETNEGVVNVLIDVIPNPFTEGDLADGVFVEYTQEGNTITIPAQLVAANEEGTMFVFLESATTNDGTITLKLKEDGSIDGSYSILYGAYKSSDYATAEYLGYYGSYLTGISYYLPGVIPVPTVAAEQGNCVLFAGLGLNGYSYTNNLAITAAKASLAFTNLTTDPTTEWDWSATKLLDNDQTQTVTGYDKEFSLEFGLNDVYQNVQLIGGNEGQMSDPFVYACGKYIDEETGAPHYTENYIYGGGTESSFILNDETPAIMTRQDPDGDLTFYTNWATPDKASNPMSKIYCYHEAPAKPLYIEGVSVPMVSFSAKDNFNLHVKICKATRTGRKLTVGDVIAEGDATSENVNNGFDNGLVAVEFAPLYIEDETGLSQELNYLFIDSEFVVIIEGWDNDTFSGVLGSQDAPLDYAGYSTWFEMVGEEGSMYSYNTWKTSLFIGLMGAAYGYLDTNDDTNITIPAEGGEASIHITPMLSSVDSETGKSKTRLFLADESEDIPDWLNVGFANEDYENSYGFDLVFSAEAASAPRSCNLVFFQEGAKLEVSVSQGGGSGINTVVTKIDNNAPAYNVAGQRVNNNFKGLVVKDGRKVMNK